MNAAVTTELKLIRPLDRRRDRARGSGRSGPVYNPATGEQTGEVAFAGQEEKSQSLNLFLVSPDLKALSHMYRHAWHSGLKTTYYLRTLGASTIEKATVQAATDVLAPAEATSVVCSVEAAARGEECEACQ